MDCGSCDFFEEIPKLKQWRQAGETAWNQTEALSVAVGACHLEAPCIHPEGGTAMSPARHIFVWVDDWCSHWSDTNSKQAEQGLKRIEEELSGGV